MDKHMSKEDRKKVEKRFDAYLNRIIYYYAMNAVRKYTDFDNVGRCVSLDDVIEDRVSALAVEGPYIDDGVVIEADFRIRVTDEQIRELLAGLTEREAQVLVLRVGFELEYDEIAERLRISKERAKAYKYHGMKKAKERAERYV